jgi:hypothetical protein
MRRYGLLGTEMSEIIVVTRGGTMFPCCLRGKLA